MKDHRKTLTWSALALLCAVGLAVVWVGLSGGSQGGSSAQAGRGAHAGEVRAESLELGQRKLTPSLRGAAQGLASGGATERAAVGPAVPAEGSSPEPGASSPWLYGVVLDPLGHGVPNATVQWVADPQTEANGIPDSFTEASARQFWSEMLTQSVSSSSSGMVAGTALFHEYPLSSSGALPPTITATDASGAFEFPRWLDRSSGVLRFGHLLFAGFAAVQRVSPGGVEQYLYLPSRPSETPLVRIALRDAQTGQDLFPDRVRPRLTGLPRVVEDAEGQALPRRALKRPRPDQILRGMGWVELQLWPGAWVVELGAEHSETVELQVQVPRSGPLIQIESALRTFDPAGGWESSTPLFEETFAPTPETAEGFDRYGKDKSPDRQLGERSSDRSFRHTLRFGVGEVSAAYLELDLEALSGMAHNDSLGLEFYAGPRFGFSDRISAFTGGSWNASTRQRLLIDLSKLPGAESPINLLPDLEDGRLDVYVQDDTAVHDVRLFLQR